MSAGETVVPQQPGAPPTPGPTPRPPGPPVPGIPFLISDLVFQKEEAISQNIWANINTRHTNNTISLSTGETVVPQQPGAPPTPGPTPRPPGPPVPGIPFLVIVLGI